MGLRLQRRDLCMYGKSGESLGTFYPQVTHDQEQIDRWQDRDVAGIQACSTCALQLACGGGCAAVAKNRTGQIATPDCRPVKELLELGMNYYFENEP